MFSSALMEMCNGLYCLAMLFKHILALHIMIFFKLSKLYGGGGGAAKRYVSPPICSWGGGGATAPSPPPPPPPRIDASMLIPCGPFDNTAWMMLFNDKLT